VFWRIIVKSENTGHAALSSSKINRHVSYTVLAEECVVEGRAFRQKRPGGYGRRRSGRIFPQTSVPQSRHKVGILYGGRLLDKSGDLHRTTAFRAFERVNTSTSSVHHLIDDFYERDPGYPTFTEGWRIRFSLSANRNGLFILTHSAFFIGVPAVIPYLVLALPLQAALAAQERRLYLPGRGTPYAVQKRAGIDRGVLKDATILSRQTIQELGISLCPHQVKIDFLLRNT
jgi:hypothetical protein